MNQDSNNQERIVALLVGHQDQLYRYIFAMLPDAAEAWDVLQETSMALVRKADEYDADRPFLAWAYRFAFLTTLDCHGEDAQEGGVRFDQLSDGFDLLRSRLWTKIHNVLQAGKMPPEGEEPPVAQQKQAVIRWIVEQDAAARRAFGSGSRRRLNRREYANLVQSVLGLDLPQFESYLPGDRKLDGFDTVAIGLQDAAAAVDAYLTAVRRVVDRIDFLAPRSSEGYLHRQRWSDPDSGPRLGRGSPLYMKHTGYVELPGSGLLFQPDTWGDDGTSTFHIQMSFDKLDFDGFMQARLKVASLAPKGVAPPTIEVLGRRGPRSRNPPHSRVHPCQSPHPHAAADRREGSTTAAVRHRLVAFLQLVERAA